MSEIAQEAVYEHVQLHGPCKQDGLNIDAVNTLVAQGRMIMWDTLLYTDKQWQRYCYNPKFQLGRLEEYYAESE